MFKIGLAGAVAAFAVSAVPASAAGFIGNNVVINRLYVGSVFQTTSTTVDSGVEYSDNFFNIDISGNAVTFSSRGGLFSTGDTIYEILGLDYDGDPATPNAIQDFTTFQFYEGGIGATPISADRASIGPDGRFRMELDYAHGGSNTYARVSFGPSVDSAVPEPATWAMMIAGFGIAGAAMRRGRRSTATLAAMV